MEATEKELLLNRGLLLGLFFSVFPFIDLLAGTEMSLSRYYGLFFGVWFIVYTIAIVFIGKEFKVRASIFNFRNAFRVLFIVSALAFSILTVTKISLWNVFYPAKYIELNEKREAELITKFIAFTESTLDKAYAEGKLTDDEYEESLIKIQEQLDFADSQIKEKGSYIKENGISKSLFVGELIYKLFFIAIYNAIIALFIRRKPEIV